MYDNLYYPAYLHRWNHVNQTEIKLGVRNAFELAETNNAWIGMCLIGDMAIG